MKCEVTELESYFKQVCDNASMRQIADVCDVDATFKSLGFDDVVHKDEKVVRLVLIGARLQLDFFFFLH